MDIILLFFLARSIGTKAQKKGQPKGRWQWFTVLAWICFEFGGFVLGFTINHNIPLSTLLGIVSGFGGYLLVRYRLEQIPDSTEVDDWMARLGKNEEDR